MATGDDIRPRDDIPLNTCKFVLDGNVYVPDGCNCSPGFEPPDPPTVTSDPESPVFVPCVPVDDSAES